ncbi:hypothetical protein ACFSAG_08485 [Sphingorhabdus buctiana]|uniref:DUF4893 domain-containing protein n=1 Tax=Sphingorhabdus buctiana TaxID=1508805 RepID=A0ABW4MD34_9SPHN
MRFPLPLRPLLFAFALLSGQAAFANPELEVADRGTVPTCSVTDALPADMAKRAAELGYVREELMPSTVTTPQFRGRLRCAKTLDGYGKMIGIALVEDFLLEGAKVRALYQGDTIVFSLAGTTPAATYPTRKGELRCYRSGAAAVIQCTTGFGPKAASMLVLQNQNEEYLLGLSVSAYDWPEQRGMPKGSVLFRAGENPPLSIGWVNQSLADAEDVNAWTAIFEGKAFTDALLQQKGPVPVEIELALADGQLVKQAFDFAEMISLYRAMAALTREMPAR